MVIDNTEITLNYITLYSLNVDIIMQDEEDQIK